MFQLKLHFFFYYKIVRVKAMKKMTMILLQIKVIPTNPEAKKTEFIDRLNLYPSTTVLINTNKTHLNHYRLKLIIIVINFKDIDETPQEKLKKKMEKMKRKVFNSSLVKDLEKEYSGAPEEIRVKLNIIND